MSSPTEVRFGRVRLRNGLGFVSPQAFALPPPAPEPEFTAAAPPSAAAWPFYVVEAREPVAVIVKDSKVEFDAEDRAALAAQLHRAGLPIVVVIRHEADGIAIAECHSELPVPFEDAACALWGLKAIGGWDQSPLMTFSISHITPRESSYREMTVHAVTVWLTARPMLRDGEWSIDVTRAAGGGWTALLAELERADTQPTVLLVDVDWAQAFNDAYGHDQGDLMLLRVHNQIAASAAAEGADLRRVGGDEFALCVHGGRERALALAESIRHEVDALRIPFEHSAVRTHGHVTVSVGLARATDPRGLRALVEDAVYAAKRRGRNSVAIAPQR